ncbi:hypothetical protein F5141DRAFT_1063631 [Pisolithus sp. B1]|nr:hypothetical protein F5141DRAFT_1063631 [Pisolithus sp. B1]
MCLTFSTNNYLNSILSNDQGQQLYTISTSGCFNSKTTITKHGQNGDDDIIGVITWHMFEDTTLWLKATSSENDWTGVEHSQLLTLKVQGTNLQLVKYHKCNMGIMSPSHPPYLEISPLVYHILDLVLVTFIYAEKMSKKKEWARAAATAS